MRRREFLGVVAAGASRFTAGANAGEPVGLGYALQVARASPLVC
jgi:hypothetical protein